MPNFDPPVMDDLLQKRAYSVYMCIHCGDEIGRVARKYCNFCGTKAQREQVDKENLEILGRKICSC